MVPGLTDTPEQALTRQLNAMIVEALALGASFANVINWYKLQSQATRDQAAAQQQAERESSSSSPASIRGSDARHGFKR